MLGQYYREAHRENGAFWTNPMHPLRRGRRNTFSDASHARSVPWTSPAARINCRSQRSCLSNVTYLPGDCYIYIDYIYARAREQRIFPLLTHWLGVCIFEVHSWKSTMNRNTDRRAKFVIFCLVVLLSVFGSGLGAAVRRSKQQVVKCPSVVTSKKFS